MAEARRLEQGGADGEDGSGRDAAGDRGVVVRLATTEIHPLRRDVEQLFEHVRGNGRPGLVQQVAILEERDRATLRQLEQAHVAIERLQQRLYMLVAGVGLSLLGAVLSFVLR